MAKIQHDAFGNYDIPAMTQGQVESFFATLREVNAGLSGVNDAMAARELLEFVTGLAKSGAKLSGEQYKTVVSEFMSNLRIVSQKRGEMTSAEYTGAVVRTAGRLGWLPFDDDGVADLKPAQVKWLSGEIQRLLDEAYRVDPS